MTPGNLELLQIVVSWTVTLPAVVGIVVRDERRLQGQLRARSWPATSRDAAIFTLWQLGMPHLCIPIHYVRTRRNLRGVGMGFLGLALVLALDAGAQFGAAQIVDWLGL